MPMCPVGEAMASSLADLDKFEYTQVQCLFCRTGQEHIVTEELCYHKGIKALFPERTKTERRNGRWVDVNKPLLPGYVFIYVLKPSESFNITSSPHVLRLLCYTDGESALRGRDRAFADWIWKQRGIIGMSKAVKVGEHVQIVEGPLKDLDGTVIMLDAHKRVAKVQLDVVGSTQWLWLSFDYIDVKLN